MGVEVRLSNGGGATVVAQLDQVEARRRLFVHPVRAFKLGEDALDCAPDAERLAAADARIGLLLLENARRSVEGEPRHEADDLFRAGRLAQAALHAGRLG